jgi:type IV secretory pathway ATPase VirB11/archaellum biosynthesis ATPase
MSNDANESNIEYPHSNNLVLLYSIIQKVEISYLILTVLDSNSTKTILTMVRGSEGWNILFYAYKQRMFPGVMMKII